MEQAMQAAGSSRTGRCHDIQRYSIHDGPGIRTTVFLQGCPLSCPWCHNPETRAGESSIRVLAARCIRCGACAEACPRGAAGDVASGRGPDGEICTRCGLCVEVCPAGARQMAGRPVTVREIVDEVSRDRPFHEESGGGVTFSGGEPLLQIDFLLACLGAFRALGVHTAVDTSGWAPTASVLEVARRADLLLWDVKLLDSGRHRLLTGVEVAPIVDNLRAAEGAGATIWLRLPLIPGVNDDRRSLEGIAAFAASLRRTRRIHLLPYHRLGSDKHRRLGAPSVLETTEPPSPERVGEAAEILRARGLEVHIGG